MSIAEQIIRAKNDYDEVYASGYERGKSEGGDTDAAYNKGLVDGIEEGKQTEREEFWANFWVSLKNSNNNSYALYAAFSGGGWNKNRFQQIIYPNETIIVKGAAATEMMYYCNRNGHYDSDMVDLTEFCQHIDLSQATSVYRIFKDARIKNVNVDLSNVTTLQEGFAISNGGYVENITLKVSDKCTNFTNTFNGSTNLGNITFTEDSVIAANISFSNSSKLTHNSLISVINALKDYSSNTTTYRLTLHATAKARLSEEEIAVATQKGWTLA